MANAPEYDKFAGDLRPLVMGILNVTPDSFSDGGRHKDPLAAAMAMIEAGAHIIDVGGESTRPGAEAVSAAEEVARTVPVIAGLRAAGVARMISIDTMKAEVAAAALKAGADVVNDVTAGEGDPEMFAVCAEHARVMILMHMRGTPRDMQTRTDYADVVTEVRDYLAGRVEAAVQAGVARDRLWIDPGFGFAKLPAHNLELVRRLDEFFALDLPVVLGASRKSTLGFLTGSPVEDREPESLAAGLAGALKGASVLRVHEPGPMIRALKVARAMLIKGSG